MGLEGDDKRSVPQFLHGLRVGASALSKAAETVSLAQHVHADLLVCGSAPPDSLLELCDREGVYILVPDRPAKVHHSCWLPPLKSPVRHFRQDPRSYPSREAWAQAAWRALQTAQQQQVAGICLTDVETLLRPENEALLWHIACCCRRIHLSESSIRIQTGSPRVAAPLQSTLEPLLLARLDVQWELLDGGKVAARGAGRVTGSPPTIHLALPASTHPDNWKEQPRLRLRFHLPPPPTSTPIIRNEEEDVLVLKRLAPGQAAPVSTVQIGGVGQEIARLEAPVEIQQPLETQLLVEDPLSTWPHGTAIQIKLINHSDRPMDMEIRLTLHTAGKMVKGLGVEELHLPTGASATRALSIHENELSPGANYILAATRSPAGVTLQSALIQRCTEKGVHLLYRNTLPTPARFWDSSDSSDSPPAMLYLAGKEERVFTFPATAARGAEELPQLSDASSPIPHSSSLDPHLFTFSPFHTSSSIPQPPLPSACGGTEGSLNAQRLTLNAFSIESFISTASLQFGESASQPPDRVEWGLNAAGIRTLLLEWKETPVSLPTHQLRCYFYADGLARIQWQEAATGGSGRRWLALRLPEAWSQVRWWRKALWDTYPAQHPDAPTGEQQIPMQLSDVYRAVLGDEPEGLVILSGSTLLDLHLADGFIELGPSSTTFARKTSQQTLEFGLYLLAANVENEAAIDPSTLWLNRPDFVQERFRLTSG